VADYQEELPRDAKAGILMLMRSTPKKASAIKSLAQIKQEKMEVDEDDLTEVVNMLVGNWNRLASHTRRALLAGIRAMVEAGAQDSEPKSKRRR
jgi:hypothetical protein